jgi:hypothetical protein
MAARGKFVNGEDRTPSPATVLSAQSTPPVGTAPAKFLDAAEGKKRAQAALDTRCDRPRTCNHCAETQRTREPCG